MPTEFALSAESEPSARAAAEGEDRNCDRGGDDAGECADHERPAVQRRAAARALCLQRRKVALANPVDLELVDPLGAREVLEVVLAEVAERDSFELVVVEHGRCRLRGEDLPAVTGRHDPRGAVHAHPVVAALLGEVRLAGVQAHAHAQLGALGPVVRRERALTVRGRGGRVARAGEDVEEGVALRVDLLAAVRGERLAEEALVRLEHAAVAVAQLFQQLRRSLDVGEEEGDGAPAAARTRI